MHTDLVCAPRFERERKERIRAVGGDQTVQRERGFSALRVRDRLEPLAVFGVADNLRADFAALVRRLSCYDGDIRFSQAAVFKLRLQPFLCVAVLCRNNHARRVFVQPMYDAGATLRKHL